MYNIKKMDIESIKNTTKHNCNISDAKYWGYYSICGMLLGLRSLYRHENGVLPWETVDEKEILPWIAQREALWTELENDEFKNIKINGIEYPPFEAEVINIKLKPHGYIYGAGYGTNLKPTFFLATLVEEKYLHGCTINYISEEICQDLHTSPAMIQGKSIYIRLSPLIKLLYETFMELHGKKYKDSLKRAFSHYGLIDKNIDDSIQISSTFNKIAMEVSSILALHEIAESVEDEGSDTWLQILRDCKDRYTNVYLRGFKDLLADTSLHGPLQYIIDNKNETLFDFYIVLLGHTVRELFPEILQAYNEFYASNDWSVIEMAIKNGFNKAKCFRDEIITTWENKKTPKAIKNYIMEYFKTITPAQRGWQ